MSDSKLGRLMSQRTPTAAELDIIEASWRRAAERRAKAHKVDPSRCAECGSEKRNAPLCDRWDCPHI